MTKVPELVITLGLAALLLYLLNRRPSRPISLLVGLGLLAVWLYATGVAVLLVLWLMSPPGIGEDNWPELLVMAALTVSLPIIALRVSARTVRTGP